MLPGKGNLFLPSTGQQGLKKVLANKQQTREQMGESEIWAAG